MADIILQFVIEKADQIAINLAAQEISHFSRMKQNVEWIRDEMEYIQSYLEDAEVKEDGDQGVARLVNDIRVLGLDVEDILDTYFPEITSPKRKGICGFLRSICGIFGYIYASHNFVVETEGIKEKVNEIKRRRETYGIQERVGRDEGTTWDIRRSFPHLDEPHVIGFDEHITKLKAKMLDSDPQCRIVSIIGMAGLGKTTLAKKVFNSVKQHFQHSAWICVSQSPNIPELLRDIARQVGLDKKEWKHDVEYNLYGFLLERKYILVIDDIWKIEPWNALRTGIPTDSETGSRIILTTRNREVGVHAGRHRSIYELQPLDEEISKSLFLKMLTRHPYNYEGTSDQVPDDQLMKNVGNQILKRCGGVPLAIVLTAGVLSLRERTEDEWKRVLERMGQEEDKCSKIFTLSYRDLPRKLRTCFLYFGIFPEDYEFRVSELINLWAAERFIQGKDTREVEEVGKSYIDYLAARNLILVVRKSFDGRIKRLRIHDIMHDLCVRVAKEINFFNILVNTDNNSTVKRMRRVTSYHGILHDSFELYHQIPRLRAMACFGANDDIPLGRDSVKKIVRSWRILRVLLLQMDISSDLCHFSLKEIGDLDRLAYLSCKLQGGKLPSTISYLRSLWTLDLRGCNGVTIPDSIIHMKQIRQILLSFRCKIEFDTNRCTSQSVEAASSSSPPIDLEKFDLVRLCGCPPHYCFPKLTNLKKLGVFQSIDNQRLNLKQLIAATWTNKLESLSVVSIKGSYIEDWDLHRYVNLKKLYLGRKLEIRSLQVNMFPPNLTKLTLDGSELAEDPMQTLGKLPKLKILHVGDDFCREKRMICGRGSFPQLQMLCIVLWEYNELIVEEEAMPELKEFIVRGAYFSCTRMITAPKRIRDIMVFKSRYSD